MAKSEAFATLFAFMSTSPGPPHGTPSGRKSSVESRERPAKSPDKSRDKNSLRDDDGRLVRGRKSRERIREAAGELFREKGFDGATLREIAKRAGMGASSIYRHVQSKEELLIDELAAIQEESWRRFREGDDRARPTRQRVHHFLRVQHELLLADRDLTMIALRATTRPDARVARRSLVLNDRTIGLLAEILQMGRKREDLVKDLNVLQAASAIFHITQGARIPWANGLVRAEACQRSIRAGVDLLFRGIHDPNAAWWKSS